MNWQSALGVLSVLVLVTHARGQEVQQDIRDFVSAPSGLSYRELAESYSAAVVPQLVSLLNSKEEEANWTRIAGLLGVVGNEQAVEALIAFMEKPLEAQRISFAHQDAYRQSIMSLGLLVNRTSNERALQYLVDGLTPSVWRQRGVQGIPPWAKSYDQSDRLLAEYALIGLAVSGNPRAGDTLRSLQQMPAVGQARFPDSTLTQWLEVHQLVAERGVAGMYEYYEAERTLRAELAEQEADGRRAEREEQRRLGEAQNPGQPAVQ